MASIPQEEGALILQGGSLGAPKDGVYKVAYSFLKHKDEEQGNPGVDYIKTHFGNKVVLTAGLENKKKSGKNDHE